MSRPAHQRRRKAENRHRYPDDWREIRAAILARAGYRCERCGLPNHAVGYRDGDGSFVPLRGNAPCDAAGDGKSWPSYDLIGYAEAREFAEQYNNHVKNRDAVSQIIIAQSFAQHQFSKNSRNRHKFKEKQTRIKVGLCKNV